MNTIPTTSGRPLVHARVNENEAHLALPGGDTERLVVDEIEGLRGRIVDHTRMTAQLHGGPVEVICTGDLGDVHLVVYPDGHVYAAGDEPEQHVDPPTEDVGVIQAAEGGEASQNSAVEPEPIEEPPTPAPQLTNVVDEATGRKASPAETTPSPDAREAVPDTVVTRRARRSFIDTREPLQLQPTSGWRRLLHALGLKIGASPEEVARELARRIVSSQWGRCRRLAVVNGKGGVGKTMTAGMLAAVFAREGGGGVVAWDNNPTRGSLGWRTESSGHDATVQDVLDEAVRLLDAAAPRALMADFVHHQVDDRYDVLRSNPELLAIRQQIATDEFDLLARIIDRHYRLVVFDSGNDESSPRWLRMIDWSHQLVVPTIPSPESAESAMLLLGELAENAVVVVTCNERQPGPELREIVTGFEESGVTTLTVPFDPALKSGPLRFGLLNPATQDAWLKVAAAAAARF
jgi:MinD-like ATPase involved in chromosome partitioning or flagellar assembly